MVEDVEFEEELDGRVSLVARVRPMSRAASRCGACGRKAGRYDAGEGRRRWRGLDFGEVLVFLEAEAPRVRCREHGVTVAAVPWARHGAGHTHGFDQQVAWLATQASTSAITVLMRIVWRTVGAIIACYWPTPLPRSMPSPGCGGSGSMRSPTIMRVIAVKGCGVDSLGNLRAPV